MDSARNLIAAGDRITILTGAGVSTASGIPDFRGPNGLWTRDPSAAKLFDFEAYRADPDLRVRAWQARSSHEAWSAAPNAAHFAIAELEAQGRVRALITQNIDELHQAAGSGEHAKLLEVHGSLRRTVCLECGRRGSMSAALARVAAGEPDPACLDCGGVQKSDTISFGQPLETEVFTAAVHAAAECDVFLAVGTSLQVYPVAGLVDIAIAAGAALVIVNAEPTVFDEVAAAVVRDPIEVALPALTRR